MAHKNVYLYYDLYLYFPILETNRIIQLILLWKVVLM